MEELNVFEQTEVSVNLNLNLDTLNKLAMLADCAALFTVEEAVTFATEYALHALSEPGEQE